MFSSPCKVGSEDVVRDICFRINGDPRIWRDKWTFKIRSIKRVIKIEIFKKVQEFIFSYSNCRDYQYFSIFSRHIWKRPKYPQQFKQDNINEFQNF